VDTALSLKPLVANANHCEVVIAPVFTSIKTVCGPLGRFKYPRSRTGLCHPERRRSAHRRDCTVHVARCGRSLCNYWAFRAAPVFIVETDKTVNQKTKAALAAGLTAIVCVGESLEQRDQGNAQNVVGSQLTGRLVELTASDISTVLSSPTSRLGDWYGTYSDAGTSAGKCTRLSGAFSRIGIPHKQRKSVRVLYGGLSQTDNTAGLMAQGDIDGALVGGASLKAESFAEIVNYKR
jgi:triosephosphate isomerase